MATTWRLSSNGMPDDAERTQVLRSLAGRLGLNIEDYRLLDQALTHASALADAPEPRRDYESLEFVGDAVLGLAIADTLYERMPDRTPGEYSKMRASVVNRKVLAGVAARLDIAPAVRLGKGEEKTGGRGRKALLADCMESIIGALYLDQGWDAAREFVTRTFRAELERAHTAEEVWDYRSRLQNYCQANRIPLPVFEVVRAEGPDHRKRFDVQIQLRGEVVGQGTGSSKKAAEQDAARAALMHEGQLGK